MAVVCISSVEAAGEAGWFLAVEGACYSCAAPLFFCCGGRRVFVSFFLSYLFVLVIMCFCSLSLSLSVLKFLMLSNLLMFLKLLDVG